MSNEQLEGRDYLDLIHIRTDEVEGINRWMWIKSDTGAWDGPVKDWIDHHKHNYLKYVKKFDVVVCAGGNQGLYPRLFANFFNCVYTFEPDPLNFHCLVNNTRLDNIVKIQAALGHANEMVGINRADMGNVGMHTVVPNRPGAHIPMLRLDDFTFPTLDLIQLDMEGFEFNALSGALQTIDQHRPVITAENGTEQIAQLLAPFNYIPVGHSVSDRIFIQKS